MINDLDETSGPLGFTAEMRPPEAGPRWPRADVRPAARYTQAMGILLTEEQDEWLKAHAIERGVSAGAVVRWALDQYRESLVST